jgi:hypothetical protein
MDTTTKPGFLLAKGWIQAFDRANTPSNKAYLCHTGKRLTMQTVWGALGGAPVGATFTGKQPSTNFRGGYMINCVADAIDRSSTKQAWAKVDR